MFKVGLICSIVTVLCLGCGGGQPGDGAVGEVVDKPDSVESSDGSGESDSAEGQAEVSREVATVLSLEGSASQKSVTVKLEVQNNTDRPFEFCKYQTPFEKTLTSGMVFQVVGVDGKELDYQGVMVKRAPPSRENDDYMTLDPGKSTSASVDIASSYAFEPGEYRLKFIGNEMNMLPGSNEILFSVE